MESVWQLGQCVGMTKVVRAREHAGGDQGTNHVWYGVERAVMVAIASLLGTGGVGDVGIAHVWGIAVAVEW